MRLIKDIILNNYKKAIKEPHRILPFLNKYFFKQEKRIREQIYNSNLIWHFCTPKSASTYLYYALENCKINSIPALPYSNNRIQMNDFFFLSQNIKKHPYNEPIYITHQHTVFDNYLNLFISEKHLVIIQTRNIYKTILSLKDFLILDERSKRNPWIHFDPKNYNKKDLIKLLIHYYVPFHVNFVKLWVESEIKAEKLFINYENFVQNPNQTLEKILNNQKKYIKQVPELNKINKQKIHYNMGLERENTLTDEEKKLIDDIVDINIKYSDPRIRSLIYQ